MKSIKKTPNPYQPESLKKVSAIGFQVSAKTKRAVKSHASRGLSKTLYSHVGGNKSFRRRGRDRFRNS